MKQIIILLFTLPFFLFCEFTGNMYSPDDPSYVPPSFTIDTDVSNVADGDTVSADTIRFTLTGNDEEYHRNRFRYQLDEGKWSDWEGDREPVYEIELLDLPGGTHTFTIEVCYNPKEEKTDSTITFFRAVKPYMEDKDDIVLAVNAQAACTLTVKAEGSGDLDYTWYRDSTLLDSVGNDTLVLEEVTIADTGLYYCFVANSWGETSSPGIRLRLLFRVFYNGNGNTGGSVPVDTNGYEIGTLAEPMNNTGNLTRRGYTFSGWNMKADGSGVSPDSGLKFEIGTDNVTLYAKWEENQSFLFSYDGNGAAKGNTPDTARMYRTGEMVAILGNSGGLEMSGYTFIGWNTKPDGSGIGYGEDDSLEMGDGNVILYAQWSDNPTFTVTYDENGADSGKAPVDAKKYEENDTVTVSGNSGCLWKEGNTFTGWNTEAQGDEGRMYTTGAEFVMGTKDVKLYARWTTNPTYTVIYMGNGNTAGSAPDSINNEVGVEITVAGQGTLVKKGYSFTGWNTAADGSGKEYKSNATYTMGSENETFYAQWEINSYRIIYDGNGSDGGTVPEPTRHRYNSKVTIASETPARTGYTFYCWNTEKSGNGDDYRSENELTIGDKDLSLYARWTVNCYTISFDGNGGTAGNVPDKIDVNFDDSVIIPGKGNLQRTGYSFTGWNTESDGSGTAYPADTTILMGAGDMKLFAQWTKNTYDVTFNKNDTSATGEMEPQPVVFGSSENLMENGFTKTGWSFAGWATSDSGEIEYEDKAKYTMGAGDVTLYAVWTKNTYAVTFYKNDTSATGEMEPQPVVFGSSENLMANGFTKTGWCFAGWATSDSSEVEYEDKAEYTIGAGDDTLYAVWTINRYLVRFDTQGGSDVDSQYVSYNDTVARPSEPTCTGHTFEGWYEDSDCTAAWVFGTNKIAAADTLYAKWTINQYLVRFDTQGGSDVDSQYVTYNDTVARPAEPNRTGHAFDGWYEDPDCTNEWVFGTNKITAADTLYAKWTINQYLVRFDTQGGSDVDSQYVTYNDTVVKPSDPTRTGYVFDGWYEDSDCTAAWVFGTNKIAAADTLYAKWTINQYLVRFDTQGGSDVDSQYVTYNDTVAKPIDPTRSGYAFDGWYEDLECTKKWNFGTMKIIFVDTIYAKWLFICTVTFDGRSATTQPVPASKIVVEGETVGTLPTAPTKTGCTFAGWYTGIVGSGTVFTASTPVTGDITVYALWTMSDGEGNVYKTVSIGSQVWTVENLRTTKYNDGTDIPHVTDGDQWSDLTTPVYCWYDNSTDPAEQEKWGALYNWYAVNTGKLAPEGWRVPTYAEWDTLQNYLIANGYNWDGTTSGNKIAKSMATQTDWTSTTTTGGIGNDPSKNNVSGFSAFPGGRRNDDGNFGLIGLYGFWWSATEYIASSAFYRLLAYNDEYLINGYGYKVYGFSVRLLRD